MASTVLPSQVLRRLFNKIKSHQPLITLLPLPFIPIPPSPHVIDTAFFLVNIPNQPTRGAAPYLPKNYWDAIKQPDYKEQWHPALSAQVKSLEDNETWELVKLPPGEVALGGQWILNQRKWYG